MSIELLLFARQLDPLRRCLEENDFHVEVQLDVTAAVEAVARREFDVAVISTGCPDPLSLVGRFHEADEALQIVLLMESGESEQAARRDSRVECISDKSAFSELDRMLRRSARITKLAHDNCRLKRLVSQLRSQSDGREGRQLRFQSDGGDGNQFRSQRDGTTHGSEIVARADLAGNSINSRVPVVGGDTDLDTIRRAHVLSVLEQHKGNKARAARALGINRRSLYRLLDKYTDSASSKAHCSGSARSSR